MRQLDEQLLQKLNKWPFGIMDWQFCDPKNLIDGEQFAELKKLRKILIKLQKLGFVIKVEEHWIITKKGYNQI